MAKPVLARRAAIVMLGVAFPILILAQALLGLASLSRTIDRSMKPAEVIDIFKRVQPLAKSPNDYALYSEMFAENVNQTVITNKQIIKVVVMEIGFAAMSLGLMFVILGFNDGGGDASGGWGDFKIDFKTASTGTLVFLMGAGMATAGGVLKNEYKSVPVPAYIVTESSGGGGPSAAETDSLNAYRQCKAAAGDAFAACFADLYGKINEEQLK